MESMTKEKAWDILGKVIENDCCDDDKAMQCSRIIGTYYGLQAILTAPERNEHES